MVSTLLGVLILIFRVCVRTRMRVCVRVRACVRWVDVWTNPGWLVVLCCLLRICRGGS